MVKIKKNCEFITPADQYRKKIKKREIERNRKERHFNRDAISKAFTNIKELREQLEVLLKMELSGKQLRKDERLRKKVLQEQYSAGIRRSLEERKQSEMEEHGGSILESYALYDPIGSAARTRTGKSIVVNKTHKTSSCDGNMPILSVPTAPSGSPQVSPIRIVSSNYVPRSELTAYVDEGFSTGSAIQSEPISIQRDSVSLPESSISNPNISIHMQRRPTHVPSNPLKPSMISAEPTARPMIPATENSELLSMVPSNVRLRNSQDKRSDPSPSVKSTFAEKQKDTSLVLETSLDEFMQEMHAMGAI